MHLAGKQDRIYRDAEIVNDRIADDLGLPGLRIDLDLAYMRAVGIGRLVLNEFAHALEVFRLLRRLCEFRIAHRAIRADDPRGAFMEFDVERRSFELIGGKLPYLSGERLARA